MSPLRKRRSNDVTDEVPVVEEQAQLNFEETSETETANAEVQNNENVESSNDEKVDDSESTKTEGDEEQKEDLLSFYELTSIEESSKNNAEKYKELYTALGKSEKCYFFFVRKRGRFSGCTGKYYSRNAGIHLPL